MLRFTHRSACRAMSCLFASCFRTRDDQSTKRGHDSKNRLSSLFLSEEETASSSCHDRERSGLDSMHIVKGLKDEGQFLKSCGAIPPATPIGIRKASKKQDTPQRGKHFGSSQSHSSNSDAVFHWDELCEEVGRSSLVTSEQTTGSISCLTDAKNSARISCGSSDAGEEESQESSGTAAFMDEVDSTVNITGKTKSLRFECYFDQSYSSTSSKRSTSRKPEMTRETNFSSTSPNPTTLKLSDEMQSAGTIFPTNQIENASSLCKLPQDSDESLEQTKVQGCKEKTEHESPTSVVTCGGKLEERSDEKYRISETRISPWVKKSKEKSNKNMESLFIAFGDRPIIGMVAAHWNEEEQSHISPKLWDGNGIPNSTNKYKEDQKVSWHATPFEERLEKALSEEEGGQSFITPRKLGIMEEAERDTAISKLHHSAQSKSIVSF